MTQWIIWINMNKSWCNMMHIYIWIWINDRFSRTVFSSQKHPDSELPESDPHSLIVLSVMSPSELHQRFSSEASLCRWNWPWVKVAITAGIRKQISQAYVVPNGNLAGFKLRPRWIWCHKFTVIGLWKVALHKIHESFAPTCTLLATSTYINSKGDTYDDVTNVVLKTCSLQPWRCSASDFRWLGR